LDTDVKPVQAPRKAGRYAASKQQQERLLAAVEPLIYNQVAADLGFDPKAPLSMQMIKPTPDEIARGKKVTKKVMGKLNRRESLPPTGDTIGIMDDPGIKPDTVEVPVVGATDAATRRTNGLD
jgi:hypothetical protein